MKLRCKPGDLAVIVRARSANNPNVGRFVQVEKWDRAESSWIVTAMSWVGVLRNGRVVMKPPGDQGLVDDENLRPIRDPGDDARDESLDWLDVPKPIEQSPIPAFMFQGA